jgi:hypothetical protein
MNYLLMSRLIVFLVGLVTFVVGERYFSAESFHWVISGAGIGLMGLGVALGLIGGVRAKKSGLVGEAAGWCYVVAYQIVVLIGMGAFLGYSSMMGTSAAPDTFGEKSLLALWLLAFMIGGFGGVGAELAFANTGRGQYAEPRRIRRAMLNWSMVGMLLGILFCFNYAVAKKNKVWDWSYLKTTTASDSTVAIANSLKDPVQIAVFYAHDNEVLPFVKQYFEYLKSKSDKISLSFYDKDMHPTKAEDFKASRNGQVVFQLKDQRERIDIGEDLKSARSTLKKLDSEVQKAVLRLAQEKKLIYFTRGHGEMAWIGETDPLRSIDLLEKILRSQNYSLRLFGVAEGSAKEVPDDASAVVVVGPTEPFMQAEADALESYVNKGGRLFVLLDVSKSFEDTAEILTSPDDPLQKMLLKFGIKFVRKTLGNEVNNISGTRSPADKWFLFSNSFSTHESVSKLAQNEERVALMFYQTGYFDVEERKGQWRGYTTVRSMKDTFVDANRNYTFDKGEETKTFSLGAAALLKIPAKDSQTEKEARIAALADANAISDGLIRNRGNAVYALDTIRWLAGQSEFSGETASEEDVKIQHTRKEDAIWFNLTVGVVPMLVLLVGFFATRKKKRKGK